tara:strand:+ start:1399 stop:1635 length:237 start_codon:yes stop_codon:yes gene_type:complete
MKHRISVYLNLIFVGALIYSTVTLLKANEKIAYLEGEVDAIKATYIRVRNIGREIDKENKELKAELEKSRKPSTKPNE